MHTVRKIEHSGWCLKAGIHNEVQLGAVIEFFLAPTRGLYCTYSIDNHVITIIFYTSRPAGASEHIRLGMLLPDTCLSSMES